VAEDVAAVNGVADGVERRLDPRFIPLQQKVGWIASAVLAIVSMLGAVVLWGSTGFSLIALGVIALIWLMFNGAVAWHGQVWPEVAFRHTSYLVDHRGIEIRRGVFWRRIINIPRSRVQHTDVSQGPLERTHELGTLVIYTAGTDHARVDLPGLTHTTALRIREHLLPKEEGDAV
jgi:membrane protein YdbS with pleckstrin-like domain